MMYSWEVSKARLDVALYPSGDSFAVAIVLEASGGYERDGLAALLAAGLPVQRVNPRATNPD